MNKENEIEESELENRFRKLWILSNPIAVIKGEIQIAKDYSNTQNTELKKEIDELKKYKLVRQLFVGKVSEILGDEKTTELLRESNDAINL